MERLNNYISEKYLTTKDPEVIIIDDSLMYSMIPDFIREIQLKGFEKPELSISIENETLNEMASICGHAIKRFFEIYKSHYVFSEPYFYWNPHNHTAGCKVQMFKKEEYEKRKK